MDEQTLDSSPGTGETGAGAPGDEPIAAETLDQHSDAGPLPESTGITSSVPATPSDVLGDAGPASEPASEQPVVPLDTDKVEALYQQSLRHLQNGEWQEASLGFVEVLRLRPGHAAAQASLEQARRKASGDEGLPERKQSKLRGVTRALALLLLAAGAIVLLVLGGRWAYARWIDKAAQETQPAGDTQVEGALQYLADRDYAAAEQAFRALLVEDPDNVQLQQGLADAQAGVALTESYKQADAAISAQNWSEAARLLNAIIAQDPQFAGAAVKLAHVQEQQNLGDMLDKAGKAFQAGDWQQAITAYEALDSSNAEYQKETVVANLFDSYLKQGRHLLQSTNGNADAAHQARALFEKALALRPQQEQATQELALVDKYLEGQAELARGNLQAAQAALEWVCQQQPEYAGGNAAILLSASKEQATVEPTPAPAEPTPTAPTPAAPTPAATPTPEGDFRQQYTNAVQQGDAAFAAGDRAQAEAAYGQAAAVAIHGGSDAARQLFAAYVKLGTTYAWRGNNGAAVPAIQTAITLMAQSGTAIPSTAYEDYVARGDGYLQKGDYAGAFAQYEAAIRVLGGKCDCGLEGWHIVP